MLYFDGREDIISTLQGFRQDNPEFVHTLAASIDNIISELDQKVPPSLYKNYSNNLRKAVDTVFRDSPDSDLANQFRANVSRFAAYKAYAVAEKCRNDAGGDKETIEAYLRIFNRYQSAEYNTARSRARTGKQWNEFQENNDIFPNIKWLLSRSVDKREEHIVFAGRVWAKDDPFWTTNQPGSLWNCKCDWQETDEPVTDGNPSNKRIVNQGLEGNPAITGEIFTDNASYIRYGRDNGIDGVDNKLFSNLQALIKVDPKEYRLDRYSDDKGFLFTSKERIKEGQTNKQEQEKFNKEYSMCLDLFNFGHTVEYLESEQGKYDILFDGQPADLKKVSSVKHIYTHAKKAINKQKAEYVIFEIDITDTKENRIDVNKELEKVRSKGFKGYYYYSFDKSNLYTILK